ncbi:MAG: PilZ domain-containing protein [Treponema sp.]|nr:PilZ domain-containing protein [Treponema sp.]
MSKLVKRIEKEFFLKILYDEQIPVSYYKNRAEYTLFLKAPPKDTLVFKTNRPIDELGVFSKISLMFTYREDSMLFDVDVVDIRNTEVVCSVPESIRKNLDRSHMRVKLPPEVQIKAAFSGDRYAFPFHRLRQFHPLRGSITALASLKEQVEALVKANGYSHKVVVFNKDHEFSTTEEQVLAHTGKIFFMPTMKDGFPQNDPYNRNRIVTEDLFRRYLLEDIGVEGRAAEAAAVNLIKEKVTSGVVSDAWVPILFQEYTVGYIRVWSRDAEKPPIDYLIIDTLYKYAEVMAQLLKDRGYFDPMKMENAPFKVNVQDISVSGLLFTCPSMDIAMKLMPECDLTVTITTLNRSLDIKATVTRNYRDKSSIFVGCHFKEMEADDIRYLFECIYAKPFTETNLTH